MRTLCSDGEGGGSEWNGSKLGIKEGETWKRRRGKKDEQ